MRLSKTELSWALAAFSGLFPRAAHAALPGIEDVADVAPALQALVAVAPLRAAWGIRIALVVVAFAPLVVLFRLRTLANVDAHERTEVMRALLAHRFYPVRQLALLVKMLGALIFARAPLVRSVMLGSRFVPAPAESGARLIDETSLARPRRVEEGTRDGRRIA